VIGARDIASAPPSNAARLPGGVDGGHAVPARARSAGLPHAADAISGCGKKILYLRVCAVASPFRFECHPERARDWS